MFWNRIIWQTLFVVAATSTLSSATKATDVYRRATVLEDRIGKVYLYSAYGVRLTVLTDCESDPGGCQQEQVYDEVVRLDFGLEHRKTVGKELIRTEEHAGTILVALSFSPDDLETFRTDLRDQLRRLSAPAFVQAFAGWRPATSPFDRVLALRSARPTWVCFESDDLSVVARFHREIHEGPEGQESISTGSRTYEEPPTPICDEMADATEGVHPEIIYTLAAPKLLREVTVHHEEAVHIDTEDTESLARRPDGVLFIRQKVPEGSTGESSGSDEAGSYAAHVAAGWRFDAYAIPAPMPIDALGRNAWLHRWTIETIERRFGPEPTDRVVGHTVLHVAYLPTVPGGIVETEEEQVVLRVPFQMPSTREMPPDRPAEIDRTAYQDTLVSRLDRHHGPPQELLEELVARPEAGLVTNAWISVSCRQDGSATYYLPPTKAHHRVLNADLFCAALESRLPQTQ